MYNLQFCLVSSIVLHAALIGELEAVKIHLEKQSRSLQDQLEDVTRKLNYLQVEKTKEREEHVASSSETSQRIQSLEQVSTQS